MHGIDENTKAVGEWVVLRNTEDHTSEVFRGNIKIPDSYYQNERVGKGVVISIGRDVKDILKEGDTVYYDLHAVEGDDYNFRGTDSPGEYVILKVDAILYRSV